MDRRRPLAGGCLIFTLALFLLATLTVIVVFGMWLS